MFRPTFEPKRATRFGAAVLVTTLALTAGLGLASPRAALAAPLKKAAGEPGTPQAKLAYQMWQDGQNAYRLTFVVVNPTKKDIALHLPTAQRYDLAVVQNGAEIWRASEGVMYAQVVSDQVLRPGQVQTYTIDLPKTLARGVYRADATFAGAPGKGVAAQLWFWVPGPAKPDPKPGPGLTALRYNLAWDPKLPRTLVFTVTNGGDKTVDLTFPTSQRFDIIARKARYASTNPAKGVVWQASAGQMYAQIVGKVSLKPGAKLVYTQAVPALAAGNYVLEAYFKADPKGAVAAKLDYQVKDPITYSLSVRNGKILFWLYNGSGKTQNLVFQDDKAYSLILVDQAGRQLWSYTGTRFYGDERLVEPMPAGANINYVANAPSAAKLGLKPGNYKLQAFFLGSDVAGPHAVCDFVVK